MAKRLLYQDLNPATTIFSNNIASKLEGDLSTTKENFLDDIAGMEVQIIRESGAVKKFQLSGKPAVDAVALTAFTATSLFNIFYQKGINGDYLAVLDQLLRDRAIPVDYLTPDQAEVVNISVAGATEFLPSKPTLSAALSTARISVTVTDIPGPSGTSVPNATVSIKEIIPVDVVCSICKEGTGCDPCPVTINAPVTLTLTNVKHEPGTKITVEASAQDYDAVTATTSVVAFATVNFDIALKDAFKLEVQVAGNGNGFVTSSPVGIDCGTHANETVGQNCTADFSSDTPVTLTASPVGSATFTGWSGGGCTGTSPCQVKMNQAQTVTATFSTEQPANKSLNFRS